LPGKAKGVTPGSCATFEIRADQIGIPTSGEAVLLPGLGVARYLWPVACALARRGWRGCLVRPPGWPNNPAGAAPDSSISELGAVTARWLETRPDPVLLIGQSIGSQVAAHAAAQVPGLVRLLLLQGPTVDPAYRNAPRLLTRWLLDAAREPIALGRTQIPEWCRAGPRQLSRLLRACLDDDLETTLADVADTGVPVRIVRGEHDALCRPGWASSLTAAPMISMPGGHASAATHPEPFADLATSLAAELR
jgi:pimeloyl-ACP methyl ester carboxylesterase